MVFEKLVQDLVFGCAYERISDKSCSATTLRRRRDEWIEAGVMEELEAMALESYDRIIGLERVMNSIRNGIGMRETEIAKEPSRPWNPHSYAVFAQVHNTL